MIDTDNTLEGERADFEGFHKHAKKTNNFRQSVLDYLYKNRKAGLSVFVFDDRSPTKKSKHLVLEGENPSDAYFWNNPMGGDYFRGDDKDYEDVGLAMQRELIMLNDIDAQFPNRVKLFQVGLGLVEMAYQKALAYIQDVYSRVSERAIYEGDFLKALKYYDMACRVEYRIRKKREEVMLKSMYEVSKGKPFERLIGYIPQSSHRVEFIKRLGYTYANISYMPNSIYDSLDPYTFNSIMENMKNPKREYTQLERMKAMIGQRLLASCLLLIPPEETFTNGIIAVTTIRDFLDLLDCVDTVDDFGWVVQNYGFMSGAIKFSP